MYIWLCMLCFFVNIYSADEPEDPHYSLMVAQCLNNVLEDDDLDNPIDSLSLADLVEKCSSSPEKIKISNLPTVSLVSNFYEKIKAGCTMKATTHHDPGLKLCNQYTRQGLSMGVIYYQKFCETEDGFYCTTKSVHCADRSRKSITFFPENWSRKRVIDEVFDTVRTGETKEALNPHYKIFVKKFSDDVSIHVMVDERTGTIVTAYPEFRNFVDKQLKARYGNKKN